MAINPDASSIGTLAVAEEELQVVVEPGGQQVGDPVLPGVVVRSDVPQVVNMAPVGASLSPSSKADRPGPPAIRPATRRG